MKRVFLCFVILIMPTAVCFSQNTDDWNWGMLVRFTPLATVAFLALGGLKIDAYWIPYVTPSIGIPVEINFASISGWASV